MKFKNITMFSLLLLFFISLIIVIEDSFAQRKSTSRGYKTYKSAKAIDGDTYKYKGKSYRIQGYNAPEIGQPGSRQATKNLQKRLSSFEYEYKPVAKDVYGRTIVKERKKK
ncbi:MAG: hypothetical protein KKF00_10995 [Proteobacteria bacterium]|nr:hypothetical protein [Pseudomonadota bacterium]